MLDKIKYAAELLKKGEVVAFPTETVFGLGADATNEAACKKIFALKGRPSGNPLIVHTNSLEKAQNIAIFNEDAIKLAKHFWPGPLSIVLSLKTNTICNVVTAGLSTIAVRMPADSVALKLIEESGGYIAAPSANRSFYVSATRRQHVEQDFKKELESQDLRILDVGGEGNATYGIESTIVDLSSDRVTILREGFISKDAIAEILGKKVSVTTELKIKAPGMMHKHYSPKTPLKLNADQFNSDEIALLFGTQEARIGSSAYSLNLSQKGDLLEAARNLYSYLRELDEIASNNSSINRIAVSPVPLEGIGIAVNDRLKRAAATS